MRLNLSTDCPTCCSVSSQVVGLSQVAEALSVLRSYARSLSLSPASCRYPGVCTEIAAWLTDATRVISAG